MQKIKTFRQGDTTWLDIQDGTDAALARLRQSGPALLEQDLKDLLRASQRPRLEHRPAYDVLVLHFPVYNRATRGIEPAEVVFLMTATMLITVHDGRLAPITDLLVALEHQAADARAVLVAGSRSLLVTLLERLLVYCNPMLDHISLDLADIDRQIFQGNERRTVREILITRRNITDFRKIMQGHKNTLKKLLDLVADEPTSQAQTVNLALESLISRTKEIWDHLESFKESVVDLHDTNESLLSNNLNETMRNYTTISVIIFSMTLVATTFGIGARGTPLVERPAAFWLLAGLLVLVALGMLEYFKKRKWL